MLNLLAAVKSADIDVTTSIIMTSWRTATETATAVKLPQRKQPQITGLTTHFLRILLEQFLWNQITSGKIFCQELPKMSPWQTRI